MTIRQTNFLLVFLVFVVFQFSLLIVRNTSTNFSTDYVEAFFLVILFTLLSLALAKKHSLVSNYTVAPGAAAGLGVYFFVRQLSTGTDIDWLVFVALIAGAVITVLVQRAVLAICKPTSV